MLSYRIDIDSGKAFITSPYNPDFISKVKLMGGKWDAGRRVWKVDEGLIEDVRSVMREVYGRDDRGELSGTCTVIVSFSEDVDGYKSPVTVFGRVIASAYGRDSGAKVGEGCAFLEGRPESGGSMKNWCTTVPAGSRVKIMNVPKCVLSDMSLPDGVSFMVTDDEINREALLEEKENLVKRLKEIDRLLGGNS